MATKPKDNWNCKPCARFFDSSDKCRECTARNGHKWFIPQKKKEAPKIDKALVNTEGVLLTFVILFDKDNNIHYVTEFNPKTGCFRCSPGEPAVRMSNKDAVDLFESICLNLDSPSRGSYPYKAVGFLKTACFTIPVNPKVEDPGAPIRFALVLHNKKTGERKYVTGKKVTSRPIVVNGDTPTHTGLFGELVGLLTEPDCRALLFTEEKADSLVQSSKWNSAMKDLELYKEEVPGKIPRNPPERKTST